MKQTEIPIVVELLEGCFSHLKDKNLSLKKNKYFNWRYSQVRVAGELESRTSMLDNFFIHRSISYDPRSPQKWPLETSELEVMYKKCTCVYLLIWLVLLLLLLSITCNQNLTISFARFLSFFPSFFFKLSIKLGVTSKRKDSVCFPTQNQLIFEEHLISQVKQRSATWSLQWPWNIHVVSPFSREGNWDWRAVTC